MNIVEPLRAILRWQARPEMWALPLGPGRWHVLFGGEERPLLLPAGSYRLQRRGLTHFIPGGWRAWYGRIVLGANRAFPAARLIPEFHLADGARGFLQAGASLPAPAHLAVRIGTAGPYQKASVLLLDGDGMGLALVKMAMVPSADHQVTVEAGWLRELEAVTELEDQVP